MAQQTIVTCPNCGTRNRLRPQPEGVPRCANCHRLLPWIVDADADSFDPEISASIPVLVDFWAPWCGPCKWVSPIIDEVGRTRAGELKVVRLNTDDAPAIAERYGILGIPTLLLVEHGEEVDRRVGAVRKPQLEEWLEQQTAAHAR
ncbi:MAG TPA: thioredoxin [Thermoleophilaceae bacterium]|jgi:thioredoxin 2|nr:thioredoxin [Thermoleophilaceae bacterium]